MKDENMIAIQDVKYTLSTTIPQMDVSYRDNLVKYITYLGKDKYKVITLNLDGSTNVHTLKGNTKVKPC